MAIENFEANIKGMHCAACSARIERVVGNLGGVTECSVNLATEKAKIVYDPVAITSTAIQEAIAGLGFSAEIATADDDATGASQEADERLRAMRNRLIPAFVLALLIMSLSMATMFGITLPEAVHPNHSPFTHAVVQFLLLLPVLYLGRNFYLNGIPALLRGGPNMDSLIAIGTGAAFVYSTWNLVEIGLGFDPTARAHDLYFESAAMLIALVSLGKYLEARSKARTTDAIKQLLQLAPETATLLEENGQRQVAVTEIRVDDRLLIRPGERIPVDGTIVDGESAVDESMLTGESMPVMKRKDDKIFGGTLNKNGALTMQAQKVGRDTMLARIVKLVQDAQGTKAPIANLADRISLYFVPTVIVIAALAGLSWFFLGDADFSFSLRIFIAVLVIACPCAMGLATPTSIMVGTGRGAQLGVLVKSGEVLELAQKVSCVVFDKTGTLTLGRPAVTDIMAFDGYDATLLLRLAAGAESRSEHPLAEAIIAEAGKKGCAVPEPESFSASPGRGITSSMQLDGNRYDVLFGNIQFLRENAIKGLGDQIERQTGELSDQGKTVLFLAVNKTLAGLLAIADPLKAEAKKTIRDLGKMGIKVVMLTGDNEKTAQAVAAQAGISRVVAGVLPDNKEEEIVRLQKSGEIVAMVGDGINDAPALARADVGIAMGTGIDVAVESADIVLMNGHLAGVGRAIGLSRATMHNIRQNLFWAFAYNVVGIPVAAGVLALFGGPTLNPMIGGAAMALSSVSVVSNALRLRWYQPDEQGP
ncbi:copper-translocating P-type ATPase [Desulfopila sp. IMCC35006]|uniref:heavy metal translocating P-type ATPase n=1 Tax=Desulfopila sp. IMCC35006 TaxID=2569542 RepID=UPI0010AC2A66|nr:heavy metal translocating P-type ATPase [Desulfopila sp. IMCC35006]TKB28070.1 copper-translocating P-type ATPase [Desulfopila sp. IMCC35006]